MSKEKQIPVSEELLLEEIRVILKDYFVASIRKAGDELRIRFAGGTEPPVEHLNCGKIVKIWI